MQSLLRVRPRHRQARFEPLESRQLLSTVYQVVDLGTLGGSISMALSINNAGQVVGQADTASVASDPFLYDPATGHMQDLGTLGGSLGSATSINNSGQIAGWSVAGDGRSHPFLYSAGKMTDLTAAGMNGGAASAINDANSVAITGSASDGSQHAVLYANGSFTDVSALLKAGASAQGQAINVSNQIAGEIVGGNLGHGWFFYNGSTANELGAPAGTDASLPFRVTSMNDGGQVVGYRMNRSADATQPLLPSGWLYANGAFTATAIAQPQFIDNSGQIVGASPITDQSGQFIYHAFLTSGGVTQDLNKVIATGSGQGWVLSQANAMNAKGEIAGWGMLNGLQHAFLLEPTQGPPPAAQGQITGAIFNDLTGDGRPNAEEPALVGWQVYIDSNNNGVLDAGEPTATSDAFGHYAFTGLLAGTYRVREVQPGGWTLTAPVSADASGPFYDAVVATNTSTVSGENFGNVAIHVSSGTGVIQGTIFNDANGNGKRQKNEKPLAGWLIFADLNNDGTFENREPVATSDASGHYAITGLGAGTYHIRQVMQPGWVATTPAAGSFDASLTSDNSIVTAPSFGDDLGARINGTVANDISGKGRIKRGAPGLGNWRVFLDLNGDGVWEPDETSALTNSAGQYTLTGLHPGKYVLRVQSQTGWQQTKPAKNAGLRVKLAWKKLLKAQTFGEHQIG